MTFLLLGGTLYLMESKKCTQRIPLKIGVTIENVPKKPWASQVFIVPDDSQRGLEAGQGTDPRDIANEENKSEMDMTTIMRWNVPLSLSLEFMIVRIRALDEIQESVPESIGMISLALSIELLMISLLKVVSALVAFWL